MNHVVSGGRNTWAGFPAYKFGYDSPDAFAAGDEEHPGSESVVTSGITPRTGDLVKAPYGDPPEDFVAKIRERTKDRNLSTHVNLLYDNAVSFVNRKMNVSQLFFRPPRGQGFDEPGSRGN